MITIDSAAYFKRETGNQFQRHYFENAVLCGECNGRGCKQCYPSQGIESFWQFMYMRYYRFHEADYITLSMKYSECVKELTK